LKEIGIGSTPGTAYAPPNCGTVVESVQESFLQLYSLSQSWNRHQARPCNVVVTHHSSPLSQIELMTDLMSRDESEKLRIGLGMPESAPGRHHQVNKLGFV
jgi:hypothetical protein